MMKGPKHFILTSGWIVICGVMVMLLAPSLQATVFIERGVQHQLETTGQAQVIISLNDPASIYADSTTRATAVAQVQSAILTQLSTKDFKLKHQYSHVPALAGTLTQNALTYLQTHPQVLSIQLDESVMTALTEGIPYVNADKIHDLSYTGQGITVAVLDSGIDTDHPDLADAIVAQHCFTEEACPPFGTNEGTSAEDDHKESHGTHVSGIITSNGIKAPRGIAPDVKIVAVKVVGYQGGTSSDMVAGLNWLLENLDTQPVDIVNLSLASGRYTKKCDGDELAKASAIDQLVARGITVFAASGNAGSSKTISSPACLEQAIAVGATYDNRDQIAQLTNRNALIDILAPGKTIVSSSIGGETLASQGTSMAAPVAAGIAALMKQANPSLTPKLIRAILKETGKTITDTKTHFEFKRVDAWEAIDKVLSDILSIEIAASAGPVFVNTHLNYFITVTNEGIKTATDIRVQNNLPSEFALVSVDGEGWDCENPVLSEKTQLVTCTLSSLPVRQSSTITLHVKTPNQTGSFEPSATAFSGQDDDNWVSNRLETRVNRAVPGIIDGSFEQGTLTPEVWHGLSTDMICHPEKCGSLSQAHSGDHHLWIDQDETMTNVHQHIIIPNGVNMLYFWLKIISGAGDHGFIRLSLDGQEIFRATSADAARYTEYAQVTLDISAYANGEPHEIGFDFETTGTHFLIDDVEIVIPEHLLQGSIFQFSARTYTVMEGELVTLAVQRLGNSQKMASINYHTSDDTGINFINYLPHSEPLTWNEGETVNQTFTISTIDDGYFKGDKTFKVSLSDATEGDSIGSPSIAMVTITDNDSPFPYLTDGGFELSAEHIEANPIWNESSDNFGTPIYICGEFCEIEPYSGNNYVWFGGIDGQEQAAVDQYLIIPSSANELTFWLRISEASGTGKDLMQVSIDNQEIFRVTDAEREHYLDYTLVTLDVSAYADDQVHNLRFHSQVFGSGITSFFIDEVTLNVPSAGTFQFAQPTYEVSENGAQVRLEVMRTGGNQGQVSVSYDIPKILWWYSGTRLIWEDGESTNKTFTIDIKDDDYFKGNKSFTIRLSNPTGGANLNESFKIARLIVVEDDKPASYIVDGSFELNINKSNQPNPVWNEFSQYSGTPRCEPRRCGPNSERHSGEGHIWFGGDIRDITINQANMLDLETAFVNQTIRIPTSATTLAFWLTIPQASDLVSDFMQVRIDNQEIFRVSGNEMTNYADYTQVLLDISAYADEENHTIHFYSESKQAIFFVDDVELITPGAGVFQFSASTYAARENENIVAIAVNRTEGSRGRVSVNYDASDNFWTYTTGKLTWEPGDTTSKTFTVNILDDDYFKHDRAFKVSLYNPSGGAQVGHVGQSEVIIEENDFPASRIVDGDFELEGVETAWNQSSKELGSLVYKGQAYSGEHSIALGGTGGEQAAIEQKILIPTLAKTLNFWLKMQEVDATSSDFLRVSIDNHEILRITSAEGEKYGDYTQIDLNIEGYADGELHDIRFYAENALSGGTRFLLDKIGLEVLSGNIAGDELSVEANLTGALPVIRQEKLCMSKRSPLDLSKDIWTDGMGLVNAINALPEFEGFPLQQNQDNGHLELSIADQRFVLIPLELHYTNAVPGLIINPDGSVIFNLSTGIAITAQPALQKSCLWEEYLKEQNFGYKNHELIEAHPRNGNLRLRQPDGHFLSVRPDFKATLVSQKRPLGLSWKPTCAGTTIPSLVFEIEGKKYQQSLYPAIFRPGAVVQYSSAEMTLLSPEIIQFNEPNRESYWEIDAKVTVAEREEKEHPFGYVSITTIPDASGDEQDDILITVTNESVLEPPTDNNQVFCSVVEADSESSQWESK